MKGKLSFIAALALGAFSALGYDYTSSLNNLNATVPDGDLDGIQSSQTLSGLSGNIAHLDVTLNIVGGFNGDFYAYLYHNGVSAILLNRVGRSSSSSVGYPDKGFGPDALANEFLFDDQAVHDVHAYRTFTYSLNGSGQLTGAWQPDGRAIDPLSSGAMFDAAGRPGMLGGFNGMDPNGVWSLYVADVSPLGEGVLQSWGLLIDVPEPPGGMLVLAGLGFLLARRRVGQGAA